MGVATLEQNTLIRLSGVEYRICRKITDTCLQIEEVKSGRRQDCEIEFLHRKYAEGELKLLGSHGSARTVFIDTCISQQDLEIAKMRRLYVLATLSVPNTRSKMEPVIRDTWRKLKMVGKPPSWTRVWEWKRRYRAAGTDYRILIDNTRRKGNRQPRYPQEVTDLSRQAIEFIYMRRERNTIEATIEDAQMRVVHENLQRPQELCLPLPTRRLIKRLIDQIPAFERHVAREGREAARRRYRTVLGHRTTERPLQRAEIDHTHLDLFVIDERTWVPLGRPYLTACIDDFTRCILGIAVGFTPPSYLSVSQCLKHCFLPKVDLREQYPDIRSEWLAFGVMDELAIDNGLEFHSSSLEQMCFSLGTELHVAPRKESWFKGKIERYFGTMNRGFSHQIPGTSFANIFDRGDYDPTKHACMTLTDLNHLLRLWIVDVYHQSVHRTLGMSPAAMWKANIRLEDIRLPDESVHLDAIVGTSFQRTLTHKGIEYEGLFYNSPELAALRRQLGDKLQVDIRVNEADIGTIYVLPPNASTPYSVPALSKKYASGLSLWAHQVIKKRTREQNKGLVDDQTLLETKHYIRNAIEESFLAKRKGVAKRRSRFLAGAGPEIGITNDPNANKAETAGKQKPSCPHTPSNPPMSLDRVPMDQIEDQDEELPDFKAELMEVSRYD